MSALKKIKKKPVTEKKTPSLRVVKKKETKDLATRKREAGRKFLAKERAKALGMKVEDYVLANFGVDIDVYVSDDFQNNLKSKVNQAIEEVNLDDIKIVEIDMHKINLDQKRLAPMPINESVDHIFSDYPGLCPATVNIFTGEGGAGKTTLCANIVNRIKEMYPHKRAGYITAEMGLIDWDHECKKTPSLKHLPVVFVRSLSQYRGQTYLAALKKIMESYDIMIIDSIAVLAARIRDNTGMKFNEAVSWLTDTMNTMAESDLRTFLAIQHFTKGKTYVGSTALKHDTTSMYYVMFDNSGRRYVFCDKSRRGGRKIPVYFEKDQHGKVIFDNDRFNIAVKDEELRIQREKEIQESRTAFSNLSAEKQAIIERIEMMSSGDDDDDE